MMKLRKLQLVMFLVLTCIYASVLGAEPNEPKTELKFEIKSHQPPAWQIRRIFRPPFESTHFAVLFVRGDWMVYARVGPIAAMLETSAGRAMSQEQRDLISNQSIQVSDYGTTIGSYTYFRLYGVSEDDTKKMVEAFIEVLAEKASARMQSLLSQREELKEKIAGVEQKILGKETELKDMGNRLEEVRKKVHYLSTDEAKKTIEELNRMLYELNIEIAGLRAKVSANEKYLREKDEVAGRSRSVSSTVLDKLEQIRSEHVIELAGALARKEAATKIRNEAEEFYNLHMQPIELQRYLSPLRKTLSSSQESLQNFEERLANPTPDMLPPKVYQNKVTIYPVRVED